MAVLVLTIAIVIYAVILLLGLAAFLAKDSDELLNPPRMESRARADSRSKRTK